MPKEQAFTVGGKTLQLSNLAKIYYPESGFTKGHMIDYYVKISEVLLPHLKDRALTLKRYPDGVEAPFFYEKECPSHHPEWMETVTVPGRHNDVNHCVITDVAGLVWVANLGSIELHTSLSRVGDRASPTMMVFDLDPGAPAGLLQCLEVAFKLKEVFDQFGLEVFPKVSGGKGLHLYVPLNTPASYDDTKAFAHAVAQLLEKTNKDLVTSTMRKDARVGKILVDWSQNDEHKTTVCVYSLRARPRPTVSAPVTWDELKRARKKGSVVSLLLEGDTVVKRVEKSGDLFAALSTLEQTLPKLH